MRNVSLFWLFISFAVALQAQNEGYIAGTVKAIESDSGLANVLVEITEIEQTLRTETNGNFMFEHVPTGTYSLSFMAPGYGRTVLLNVEVHSGQTWYDVIYLQKTPDEDEQFYIGGIEVTATRELLPEKASTTTSISSGEIEHIQASSLGDVLELIPGQKFTNPGLEDVKQISIRQTSTTDDADRNVSLGTQILVDDVPISNNANMQIDTDLNDGATYRVTANAGIDLRRIAADNIQSIEVIRGIPSAKYGDLTAGAVVVNTKSGYTPYRTKYKYNPRNQELNLAGGYQWENHDLNFNLNYAKSLRNIRVEGDAFRRIGGQLNLFSYFNQRKIKWTNRLYYTRTLDEQDVREGDLTATERYNRDYESRLVSHLTYNPAKNREYSALFSLNLNRQNSYIKRRVSRDIGVIGTAMEPGVNEGYFVVDYTSKLWVKGQAWNLFGQLNYSDKQVTGKLVHDLQAGLDIRHEFNNGPGREFDPLYPPRSTADEGDRPRSYNDIPGITQLALYAEDELTGHLWRDFSFQMGLRYDMFGFDFSGFKSDFGSYFNPRLNFVYYLTSSTQFRMGYGRNAKIPPMSMVYPNYVYFDVVDSMYFDTQNPENRLAIVNTQIFDRTDKNLKAMTRSKYETSVDQKVGPVGLSVTGFYERMHDGFDLSAYYPVSLVKYSRPDWPNPIPAVPRDTVLLNYNGAVNSVESESKGIELALTTKQIESINTTIRIDAAYHFSKSWWQNNQYEYGGLRTVPGFNDQIVPFWNLTGSQSEDFIIHYRFDTIFKPLRLWFTINIQQVAVEKDRYNGLSDSLAVGYISVDGQRNFIPDEERDSEKYSTIRRVASDYMYTTESLPNLWLINLRVSKELWKGSEVSFFVNNMFNSRPLYQRTRVPSGSLSYIQRNPEIFYGVEFSTVIDEFVNYIKRF